MIAIDKNSIDEWLVDFDKFNYSFRAFCFAQFRVFDLRADFVPNVLNQAHKQWVEDCASWLANETHHTTKQLSHVKMIALLLYNLVSTNFLGNFFDHEYQEEPKFTFQGSYVDRGYAKQDLIDGREAVLSMDFCLSVIAWFEQNRTDRAEDYKNPLTKDMRHDILTYLISEKCDVKGLYLTLKALFLRAGGNGNAN